MEKVLCTGDACQDAVFNQLGRELLHISVLGLCKVCCDYTLCQGREFVGRLN